MIDETTDVTNQEQVTIVLRRIDDNFETYEEFIGLYMVSSIEAECLTEVIKDTINLSIQKLRGQCYDGCSTMSGIRTGVTKRISDEEPHAVFTHCYGHSLNLACITLGENLMGFVISCVVSKPASQALTFSQYHCSFQEV